MKDCFGRVIADSSKLEECHSCEDREACRAIQWGDNASSVQPLPRATVDGSPSRS